MAFGRWMRPPQRNHATRPEPLRTNSDFTTFLHEEMYVTRDGVVEQVWPVLGRGKLR